MELLILSPERTVFSGKVEKASFPGATERYTVLKRHAPLIALLAAGTVGYKPEEGEECSVEIVSGCVRVFADRIEVCVETAV